MQQVLFKYFDGTRRGPASLIPVRIPLEHSGTVLFTSGSEPVRGIFSMFEVLDFACLPL